MRIVSPLSICVTVRRLLCVYVVCDIHTPYAYVRVVCHFLCQPIRRMSRCVSLAHRSVAMTTGLRIPMSFFIRTLSPSKPKQRKSLYKNQITNKVMGPFIGMRRIASLLSPVASRSRGSHIEMEGLMDSTDL